MLKASRNTTTFHTMNDIVPFFRVAKRASGGWYGYLHNCAHRAFVDGQSENEAREALGRHVRTNESTIRRSMQILGLLP